MCDWWAAMTIHIHHMALFAAGKPCVVFELQAIRKHSYMQSYVAARYRYMYYVYIRYIYILYIYGTYVE